MGDDVAALSHPIASSSEPAISCVMCLVAQVMGASVSASMMPQE